MQCRLEVSEVGGISGTLVTRNGLRRDHSGLVVTKIGRYITLER